jgi:hypothetical protein
VSIRPIFIFSAPRSGSTLLQRVLAAHPDVATASEPWLLLPMLTPLYDDLPASGARVETIHEAVRDFIAGLPNGRADYREAVRDCALALYTAVTDPTATYFVDKSPMYHLIVDEIFATFPEGRFLFLFRNPLSVIASCIELFDNGRWEVSRYHAALFESFAYLAPGSVRYASRSLTVRFEDLVTGDEVPWRRILDYLELPWDPLVMKHFSTVELRGRLGDPTGVVAYSALSQEPLEKWRGTLGNPVRRAWCSRYLQWLGRERLEAMGYDLDELQRELNTIPLSREGIWEDAGLMAASLIRELVKARLPRYSSRASTWRALLSA